MHSLVNLFLEYQGDLNGTLLCVCGCCVCVCVCVHMVAGALYNKPNQHIPGNVT